MLFHKKHPDICAFCGNTLDGYGWRERGRTYCNEFCAADEEECDRARPTTLARLETILSEPLENPDAR